MVQKEHKVTSTIQYFCDKTMEVLNKVQINIVPSVVDSSVMVLNLYTTSTFLREI